MIERSKYLNTLINSIDNGMVKLLVGVRRSGKSTLLKMLQEHMKKNGVKSNQIIEINFEMIEFDYLKDMYTLNDYIKSKSSNKDKTYLFIDEVQEIPEWARVVNSLRVTYNIDIYVTGSNARVFSGEHLTYLSGRYLSIDVFPLSYFEYEIFNKENNIESSYNDFLDSSFPAIVLEPNNEIKNIMKQDLYDAIFQRDIILRGKIRNESTFLKVARFVLEHIGSQISVNKIKNTLISNGTKVSFDAVDNYVNMMLKSYFIYSCERYDIKGKEILKSNCKYYAVDFGIREKIIPNTNTNTGRILENFVYLELIKNGYNVYTGKVGRDYELDFVATKGDRKLYVQVSESIIDLTIREREARPFKYIGDLSERYLVTFDQIKYKFDNFKHCTIMEFLNLI